MFLYLSKKIIPKRLKSLYELQYGNMRNNHEEKTNQLLSNPFISPEIKVKEQKKKEKRKKFRTLSKKYKIVKNRLVYTYKYNNKNIEKKIPYIIELDDILYNAHVGLIYNGYEKAKKVLL